MVEALVLLGLAFLVVTLVFKALIALVLLPFRVVGAAFRLVGRIALGLGKVVAGVAMAVASVIAVVFGLVLLPLAPLLLVAGVVWLLVRRPKARVPRAA